MTFPKAETRARRVQPFLLAGRFLFTPPSQSTKLPGATITPTQPDLSTAPAAPVDELGWASAGKWLPAWGLLIGVFYALVFGVCWRAFGEYQGIRWLPAVAVLAADLGACGFRLLAGTASLAARRDLGKPVPVAATLTIVLIALTKFGLLASLPIGIWLSAAGGSHPAWVDQLGRLRSLQPAPIYRPLILMPLWGRYAVELAMTIGRTTPDSSPRFRRMADGATVTTIFLHWTLCAALTILHCSGSGQHLARPVMMALGVLVVVYLASFTMAHRLNGQNEATVGAAGLVGELTFLVLYISLSSAIYWY